MKTKEEVMETLARLEPEIRARFHVRKMGLFGSYARKEQRPESDIDLLVDFSEDADLFDLAGLKIFLEERFHSTIDVVPARALRDELKGAVLADVSYV